MGERRRYEDGEYHQSTTANEKEDSVDSGSRLKYPQTTSSVVSKDTKHHARAFGKEDFERRCNETVLVYRGGLFWNELQGMENKHIPQYF